MCDHAVLPAPLMPPDSAGNGATGRSAQRDDPQAPVTGRTTAAPPRQAADRPALSRNEQAQTPVGTQLAHPASAAPHGTTPAAPSHKYEHVFPGTPSQVRQARKFLTAALHGCSVADDAVLCLSELASNSVLHSASKNSGGTFTVRAEVRDGDYVWVEVEDNGGTWEEHSHRDGRPHGLDIIRDLTTDNGRDGDPVTGWVMWMRFDWTASATDRQVPPAPQH